MRATCGPQAGDRSSSALQSRSSSPSWWACSAMARASRWTATASACAVSPSLTPRTSSGASPKPRRKKRWIIAIPLASQVLGASAGMSPVEGSGVAGMIGSSRVEQFFTGGSNVVTPTGVEQGPHRRPVAWLTSSLCALNPRRTRRTPRTGCARCRVGCVARTVRPVAGSTPRARGTRTIAASDASATSPTTVCSGTGSRSVSPCSVTAARPCAASAR